MVKRFIDPWIDAWIDSAAAASVRPNDLEFTLAMGHGRPPRGIDRIR